MKFIHGFLIVCSFSMVTGLFAASRPITPPNQMIIKGEIPTPGAPVKGPR